MGKLDETPGWVWPLTTLNPLSERERRIPKTHAAVPALRASVRVETLGAFRGTGLVDLCFFWGFRTPQAAARKTGTPSGKKVSPQTTGTIDQFVKSTAPPSPSPLR